MTISSSTRKAGPYTGNGVTTVFSFSFKVFTQADLEVIRTDLDEIESTLVLGTDYTVTLNANQNSNPGGNITMLSAPATGFKITITSDLAYTQNLDLTNQGGFYPTTINDALDRATIQIQQLAEQVSRSVKTDISSAITPDQLLDQITQDVADAALSADQAQTSATAAQNTFNTFRGQYYGTASSDPAVDPLGAAPTAGDLYFNTASNTMRVYTGTAWQDVVQGVSFPYTTFSGNGSTTAFTLTGTPGSLGSIEAFISGVRQTPGTDYTWSGGTTLTFTSAPPSGTNNVFVRWLTTQAINVPADGSVTTAKIADAAVTPAQLADGVGTGNNQYVKRDASARIPIGTNWSVFESGGVLFFRSGTTNLAKLDASGNLTVAGNVTAYGTV